MKFLHGPRHWLGPLGRYRPSLLRKDMAQGFELGQERKLPGWMLHFVSPEERLLEGLELRGKVVYDVGAHRGLYTLFFSRRVGEGGTVIAFEPQPESFARLCFHLQHNQVTNVIALPVALGAVREIRPMYVLPGMSTTVSLAAEARTFLRRRIGQAKVEPLDDLAAQLRLPPPDFVKIDVEGLELEVLQGGQKIIQQHRPDLLIEIHGADREQKSKRTQNIAALLAASGYVLHHAESGAQLQGGGWPVSAGHLFARRQPETA